MENTKLLDDVARDLMFKKARTYNNWKKQDVSDVIVKAAYELMKFGPTAANCSPLRIKFVKSKEAKEKLKPHLAVGNVDKTMNAPLTALFAYDLEFYEHLPKLSPHTDAKSWYEGNDEAILDTARRNGTLQGAYFIMAARSVGLDCGPMSGFDPKGVKDAFFADENVALDFICNLGYGDEDSLYPRSPRFEFDDVCEIL